MINQKPTVAIFTLIDLEHYANFGTDLEPAYGYYRNVECRF